MSAEQQQDRQNCVAETVDAYLDRTLSARDEQQFESHLDECEICRGRLDQSAAIKDQWDSVTTYLSEDEWDDDSTASALRSADSLWRGHERPSQSIITRQIEQWLQPTDDPRMIGRFGGYEILGLIGQGGMGVVLKGFEVSLNRYVAIKVLSPHLASSGAARQRFAREAQAAAAVLHENVIAIYRVAEADGLPYLVMPYVAGVSLQRRLDDEGPLALPAILRIGKQIAAGLSAAHSQGLVHRDIKPANILMDIGVERVTITDFGLARAVDDGSVTRTGVIAGTPQYMSPEQAQGDAIDSRSDLFSLGSVMYAMCIGHPPFRAETTYGILRRISDHTPRPIREFNPELPEWMNQLVQRLLHKSPADRFQSAAEVGQVLEQCLAHVQTPHKPLPAELQPQRIAGGSTFSRNKWALVAGIVCLVLAAIFIRGAINQPKPETDDIANRVLSATPDTSDTDPQQHDQTGGSTPSDTTSLSDAWISTADTLLDDTEQSIEQLKSDSERAFGDNSSTN